MGITENLNRNLDCTVWHGQIPVNYLYTYGVAGDVFFKAIKERGVFCATRCAKCDMTFVPPRIYCPQCMAELKDFIDIKNEAKIETFTVCHEDVEGKRLPEPVILGVAKFEGTVGGLVHRLNVESASNAKIGMPVKAVFKDALARQGVIDDILHIIPA